MASFWRIAAVVAGSLAFASSATAQEKSECSAKITRNNVVSCALAASLNVRVEEDTRVAFRGKRTAVSSVLPTNPVLALTGARRGATLGEATAFNWTATLSQELEIAGQRGSRLRAADADLDAQSKRVTLSKRETAILAWNVYFEVLAAVEEQRLAQGLLSAAQRMSEVTRARADKGVGATVDADVADAATLRVLQAKLGAERNLSTAGAQLSLLLGRDPTLGAPAMEGDLTPLAGLPDAAVKTGDKAIAERPEVQVFDADRRAMDARAEAFRRARVPNPTLSVFAQNDGYNERVFGVGLSFPIPLPTPIGRTYAGEIAEAEALAQRARTEKARAEREVRLEVATAKANYLAHQQAVDAMKPDALQRARTSLRDLAQEIDAGRISVREALVSQQTLIELLQSNIAERKALCLASVELARALGIPLETGAR